MLDRLWKPWFVYRPDRLVKRAWASWKTPRAGYALLMTSWGAPIWADPTKTIGRSIIHTGVHDLAVSEMLVRLIDPGDLVIDAGANVGYMTALAALAAGGSGRVLAFEPHPELFAILQKNLALLAVNHNIAKTDLHNSALGDHAGTVKLILPDHFGDNDGVARVATSDIPKNSDIANQRSIPAPMVRLDAVLDLIPETIPAAVCKLDVEGFEPQVLRGAEKALRCGRIRHIVFEDHDIGTSEVIPILRDSGYVVHAFGWSLRGLTLAPMESGRCLAASYEAPNYLASRADAAADALERCRAKGWRVLDRRFPKRCGAGAGTGTKSA